MENRTILLAYLAVWCAYVLAAHTWGWRKRLHPAGIIASHAAPSAVAVAMTSIFLLAGGSTIAQFAAGSESGMDLWSLWFRLWPALLLVTAASGVMSLVWTIIASVNNSRRRWTPVTLAGVIMSVFAFLTVAANFPDA
jgi:hypothetical protein